MKATGAKSVMSLRRGLRRRLTYANVMATLALFFALTGGAMAAGKDLTPSDPISAGDLEGSTYGIPEIAPGKVTSEKLANEAVGTPQIANGGILTQDFADQAVTSQKIAIGGVFTQNITDDAVTGPKLASQVVTDEKLANGAVTGPKLASQAVTDENIADTAVTGPKLAVGAVNYALADQKCEQGQYLQGFDKDGKLICAALP
jgi:Repeat of unknown function (DUF5907)